MKNTVGLIFLFLTIHSSVFGQFDFMPAKLTGLVNDLTNTTLDISEIEALSSEVQRINNATGNKIVVVLIQTTAGERLEDFSLRMANQWQIGQKRKDNGILVLVVVKDRKVRIEVGKGMASVVSKKDAERIIFQKMAIHFKLNNYKLGLDEGLKELEKVMLENAASAAENYAKYKYLWLFIPWFLLIELLKRTVKYKWLVKIGGFLGYMFIGMQAVEIGVSIGFAFILFLLSFLAFKYPKHRYVLRKSGSRTNDDSRFVYALGFMGLSLMSKSDDNPGHAYKGGYNASGGDSYGSGFGGGGGSVGDGGSFGGDGGSGSW